ncbi:MAG: hypothetical protein HYY00_00405 [Chloroflexi bacterium]|nr:hypothetical protein [Chloroflexota bacterium]
MVNSDRSRESFSDLSNRERRTMRVATRMKVMVLAAAAVVAGLPALLWAQGPPQLPAIFSGTARFYNPAQPASVADALAGSLLVARVGGVERGRMELPAAGVFGPCSVRECLLVQGEITVGATVEFYVGGSKADQTATFQSGGISTIDLAVPDGVPPTAPGSLTRLAAPTSDLGRFSWTAATDAGAGLAGYEVSLDSAAWQQVGPGTLWNMAVPVPQGQHIVEVRAVDRVGNRGGVASLAFMVDTLPPVLAGPPVKTSPDSEAAPLFSWPAGEDKESGIVGYEVRLDDGAPVPVGGTTWRPQASLADGRHRLALAARDAVGNLSPALVLEFLVDATPPSAPGALSGVSPANVSTPEFRWEGAEDEVSEVVGYQVSVDGGEWRSAGEGVTWKAQESLPDGKHTVAVRGMDAAGNVGPPAALEFLVDATPPGPPQALEHTPIRGDVPPTFSWVQASDALSGVAAYQVSLDVAPWLSVGLATSWTPPSALGDGRHTLSVRAMDGASNAGPAASVDFVVDRTPPVVSEVSVSVGGPGEVLLRWRTDEPSRVQVLYGETEGYGLSTPVSEEAGREHNATLSGLRPGSTVHLRIRAVDVLGNESLTEDRALVLSGASTFDVSNITISSPFALPGEPVAISATVSAAGGAEARYQLSLLIGGEVVEQASGSVSPGTAVQVSFTVRRQQPGEYQVAIGPLKGRFTVVEPLVQARLQPVVVVDVAASVATDQRGELLKVTGANVETREAAEGGLWLVLPVALAAGERLGSFVDRTSGISATADRVILPVRDQAGRVVMKVIAETEGMVGTGQAAEARVRALFLESQPQVVDLAPYDATVQQVSVLLSAELKAMPPGNSSMEVAVRKEPSRNNVEALRQIAEAERRTLRDIAFAVDVVKSGLRDVEDVGRTKITLKVGRAWVEKFGPGSVQVYRLSDAGGREVLSTSFLGFSDSSATFEAVSPGGLSIFALVATEPLPARLEVSGLAISPRAVLPGQPVSVRVNVANTGGTRGERRIILYVNGAEEATQDVGLAIGEAKSVSFSFARAQPGEYTVAVEGLEERVTVQEALLEAYALAVGPEQATVGQTVSVTVSLRNSAGVPVQQEVVLEVGDTAETSVVVALGPGESKDVTLSFSRAQPGRYRVRVMDMEKEVLVLLPARLSVANLRLTPPAPSAGQAATVSVDVENVGGLPGTFSGALRVDGQVQEEREINLAPGEKATLTFVVALKAGMHRLEVGGAVATIEVTGGVAAWLLALIAVGVLAVAGAVAAVAYRWRRGLARAR